MADADGRRRGEGGGVDGAPPVDAGRPRVCDRAGPGGGGQRGHASVAAPAAPAACLR